MYKTKMQAMIEFLEAQIKEVDNDAGKYVMIKDYINGIRWAYKASLDKAIEIDNNDDLD